LREEDIKFDSYLNEIHFNNGYFNLESGKFCERELGKHFITSYIKHDYTKPSEKNKKKLKEYISKIYPDEKVRKTILKILGSALTGMAIRDSYILFFIGEGSAGKSTIMNLAKYSVECYVKQILL
jgi:phage/plasmid-associated DNA primase